jgi:hypothetical protein
LDQYGLQECRLFIRKGTHNTLLSLALKLPSTIHPGPLSTSQTPSVLNNWTTGFGMLPLPISARTVAGTLKPLNLGGPVQTLALGFNISVPYMGLSDTHSEYPPIKYQFHLTLQ